MKNKNTGFIIHLFCRRKKNQKEIFFFFAGKNNESGQSKEKYIK
jgi:hypothetical protein